MPQMRHLLKGAAYLRLAFGIIIFAFKITESMFLILIISGLCSLFGFGGSAYQLFCPRWGPQSGMALI